METPPQFFEICGLKYPCVRVPGDQQPFSLFAQSMADELKDKGIYRLGSEIVMHNEAAGRLDRVTPNILRDWSQRHVVTWDGTSLQELPLKVFERLISSFDFLAAIPRVDKIRPYPSPVMANGVLLLRPPGYHEETKTFSFPRTEGRDLYDDSMSLRQAADFLRKIHAGFTFQDAPSFSDRAPIGGGFNRPHPSIGLAAQIAAMLTRFAGDCIPQSAARMRFLYCGRGAAVDKSRLARIVGAPAHDESEGELVLAESESSCFGEMEESIMAIRLAAGSPSAAVPVEDIIDEVWLADSTNRDEILSSLWTIVRRWHAGDLARGIEPMAKASRWGFKPRSGYEWWGEIIGGMVAFAGFGNCLERTDPDRTESIEDRNIRRLVVKLRDAVVAAKVTAREYEFQSIVTCCHADGIFDYKLEGELDNGMNFKMTPKANSHFGLLLGRIAPAKKARSYRFTPGELICLSNNGKKGRHKRYLVEVIPA